VRLTAFLFQFVELAEYRRVLHAPTDVELRPGTIGQPDAFVLLRKNLGRIEKKRVFGAPDLAVEILSPGTQRHDITVKYEAYAQAGV